MILEPLRIVRDWMNNGTYGVNAKLAALTLDGGDVVPPNIVGVLEPTSSDFAAREQAGTDWPVLIVDTPEPTDWKGEVATTYRDSVRFPLGVWYVTRKEGAEAKRDLAYTIRAVMQSLREMERNANYASRQRNGINLVALLNVKVGWVGQKLKDGMVVAGGIVMDAFVRDTTP